MLVHRYIMTCVVLYLQSGRKIKDQRAKGRDQLRKQLKCETKEFGSWHSKTESTLLKRHAIMEPDLSIHLY